MAPSCAEAPWSPPTWSSPPGTAVTGKSELVLVASEDHCGCTKSMVFTLRIFVETATRTNLNL